MEVLGHTIVKSVAKVPPGFEPGVMELQSTALPLGYGTKKIETRC